jgi:hypothetical protein
MRTITQRLGVKKVDEFLIGNMELGLDVYLREKPSREMQRELFEDVVRQLKDMFPQLIFDEPKNIDLRDLSNSTPRVISSPYEIGLEVRHMHGGEDDHGLIIRTLGGINYDKTKQFFSHYKQTLDLGEH